VIWLSLFNGMNCGRIAIDSTDLKCTKYYSSEIDKHANIVTQANYPDTIQLGDITKWKEWNIEQPDIIIAGSPCQGFSFAGKQLNFNDPRSALFFTFVDILKHYKPKYFLLENVVMAKQHNDVISGMLGEIYPECVTQGELFRTGRLEPMLINSALVSAQNRKRLYWFNWTVEQPADKGILLKDIIEDATADREKSYCLDANYWKGCSKEYSDLKCRRQMVLGGAFRGRNPENPKSRQSGLPTKQMLEINETGKSNCLTSVQKDNIVCYGKNYIQYKNNDKNLSSQENRIRFKDGKSNTITVSHSSTPKIKETEIIWRKLTPLECERLQTVPDNYTLIVNRKHPKKQLVSNSQRYRMLGNGWTVDVIAHILSGIPGADKCTNQT
jgi:DNA-cytosine methyltransferase